MAVERLEEVPGVVVAILAARKVPYLITGMFAGNYWLGERAERLTYDVDFSIAAPRTALGPVVEELRGMGWEVRHDTAEQIQLQIPETPFKVDLLKAILPGEAESEEERHLANFFQEAHRRGAVRTVGGRRMRISRPEYIVVLKALLNRPKDGEDVRLLLRLEDLDRKYLVRWVRALGLVERYAGMAEG